MGILQNATFNSSCKLTYNHSAFATRRVYICMYVMIFILHCPVEEMQFVLQ